MAQYSNHGRWYIRKDGRVFGPFPNHLISSYLILGRFDLEVEASPDQTHWAPVKNYRALVPDVVLNAGTPEGAKALMMARLREDERSARAEDASIERRALEDQAIKLHRQLHEDIRSQYHQRFQLNWLYSLPVLLLVVVLLLAFLFCKPQKLLSTADCSAPAASGVDWSFCNKQSAKLLLRDLSGVNLSNTRLNSANLMGSRLDDSNMSYANLTQANLQNTSLRRVFLKGAVLNQADIQGANLTGADLSYAELSGALLKGAVLQDARFDHAIWVNGETCLANSVGECLQAK